MSKTIQPICRLNHDVERKIIVFKIIIQQDWMDVAIELHDKFQRMQAEKDALFSSVPFHHAAVHMNRFYTNPKMPCPAGRGTLLGWNYMDLGFFNIDFGWGKPTRGIHWCFQQPVKVVPTATGDYEVIVTTDDPQFGVTKAVEPRQSDYMRECSIASALSIGIIPFLMPNRLTSSAGSASKGRLLVGLGIASLALLAKSVLSSAYRRRTQAAKKAYVDALRDLPGNYLEIHQAKHSLHY